MVTDINALLERDRKLLRRSYHHEDEVLPIVKEAIGADDVSITRTDDIFTDALKYRFVLPSGLALPCSFTGLELLQNSGEHLRLLVFSRVNEAFGKLAASVG